MPAAANTFVDIGLFVEFPRFRIFHEPNRDAPKRQKMVDCGRERQRYALLGAVAGLAVVCAVAVLATRISSTNLVDKPNVSGKREMREWTT